MKFMVNNLDEFGCIDYDMVCTKNITKADSICFHIRDCNKVTVYVVEKKETLDLKSNELEKALNQIEQTINYLSSVCENVKCEKIIVAGHLTQSGG